MTDADEAVADVAPGVARLNALSQGGFSSDEVNQYRDRVSGQMNAAGFSQEEIQNYWGIKTPKMDGVHEIANTTGDTSPQNPDMRKELVSSYERGETRNPSEFSNTAFSSLVDAAKVTGSTLGKYEAYLLTSTPASIVSDIVQNTINLPVKGASRLAGAAYEAAGGELTVPQAETLTQGIPEFGQTEANKQLREITQKPFEYEPKTTTGEVTSATLNMAPYIAGGEGSLIQKAIGTLASGTGSVAGSNLAKAMGFGEKGQQVGNLLGSMPGMFYGAREPQDKATSWDVQPAAQHFPDAALVLNGKDAEAEVSQVLRNIYAEKGISPEQVVADAKSNPTIQQDLAAGKIPEVYNEPQKAPSNQPAAAEPVPQAGTEAVAPKVGNAGFEMLAPGDLTLDPKRFQYKAADEKGVTGALHGVDTWEPALANPITVWRAEDGKTYVVNGHQRTDLATRAEAAGQEGVQIPSRVFNESDGYTAEYMRALGARQNIAEGSGTAIDAAKIMRGAAIPDSMRLPDLPPKSQLVQQARGLAALGDDSFGMVVNEVVPAGYAAEVGRAISDPKEQLAAMDVLAKSQPANVEQARMIVQDVKNSGFLHGEQTGLFGDEAFAQSLFAERSRILDNATRQLRQLKSTFNTAVTQEGALTEAGNVLSKEKNLNAKESNEKLIAALQADATRKGPISDALSDAARQLQAGQSVASVTKQFLERARELTARSGREQLQPGNNARGNEPAAGGTGVGAQPRQTTIPGTEPISDKELAERKMQQPNRAGVAQEPANEGLFDVAGRGQKALFNRSESMTAINDAARDASALVRAGQDIGEGRTAVAGMAIDNETLQYQAAGSTKEQLFAKAEQLKKPYTSWIKDLTNDVDGAKPYSEGKGGTSGVRIKNEAGRIDEKIAEKHGNASQISDYLGGAIQVDNPHALQQIIDRIGKSDKRVLEVEDMLTSDDKTKNDGYRALHMQVELEPGFSAELQIIPSSIAKIKEEMHAEYAKLRDAGDTAIADRARAKMVSEYDLAFNKFLGSIPEGAIKVAPGLAAMPKETYTAQETKIVQAVNDELRRLLGGKVDIGVSDKLYSTGELGQPGEVSGYYNKRRNFTTGEVRYVVHYALSDGDPMATIRHEVIHALRKTLTPDEWSTLEDAAKSENWIGRYNIDSRYGDLNKVQKLEEAVAEEFARGREDKFQYLPDSIRPIFEKMQQFISTVADKVRQIFGADTRAQDVFSRIQSGEVGGRDVPGGAGGNGGKFLTPEETKILDRIQVGGKEKERAPLSWDDFYKAAVDRLDPIRRVMEDMKAGNMTSAQDNAYKLARNLAGNYGRAQQFIEGHTFDFNTYQNTGKSLKEILAPVKDDINGLRAYAASRRALELDARGIKTGMDITAARDVIAKGAQKFEPIFKELNDYQNSLLKYMKDAGVLTDEQIASMKGANNAYIPFYRVMDEDGASVGLGAGKIRNPIKRIKGSERMVIDPIESIVKNTYSYVSLAERNAAVKSFFDRASKEANPADYFTKQSAKIAPTKVTEAEMEKFLKDNGIDDIPDNTLTIFRAMKTPLARDEVGFFDKGKWTVLKVDPDMAEAFNATPRQAHGFLFKALQVPAKMLRYGIISPEFIIRHLERNALSSTVIGEKATVPFENLYKGLFSYLGKDAAYEDWLKSGGKVSSLSGLTRDSLVDQVRSLTGETPATNIMQKAWNVVKSPFDFIHALQQNLENINRLGAYKKAIEGLNVNKDSIINSGYYARNVAPDPARIGTQTGAWNALTALANTEIQHTAQVVDALRSRPLPTLAKGIAMITLPTLVNWAYNHNNQAYQESPAWERDAFWIIPAGQYTVRIPKPFLMGFLFGTVPERIADLVSGNDKNGEGMEKMLKDMFEQATPNYIPNAIMPVLEQVTNHSMFRAKPLVPDHLMQELPEFRYSEYTSELTKSIARLVGTVPYVKNTSIASPMVLDNYMRQWTGPLGTYVLNGADAALRTAGVLPDPVLPTRTLADIPFVRAFVSRYPSYQAESIQRFQDNYNQMKEYQNTYKDLIKQGEVDQAQNLLANNPGQFFKLDMMSKTISEQNKLIRMIYKNPAITGDEKRQIIDATYYQMINIARQGNDIIDQMHQSTAATRH